MSRPRVFFAAMPPAAVRQAIAGALHGHGIDRQLGGRQFAAGNWHQTLSGRCFEPGPVQLAALQAVGASVIAHACTLQYNRITSSRDAEGRIHVTLRAHGEPPSFRELVGQLQQALREAGQDALCAGVSAHTTLGYDAPAVLDTVYLEPMLRWTIDELLLLVGHGQPYRYDVIGRWPLLAERDPPPTQMGLF